MKGVGEHQSVDTSAVESDLPIAFSDRRQTVMFVPESESNEADGRY